MVNRPTSDQPFFREWEGRDHVTKRSLERTAALMKILGINGKLSVPTIAIVGSKGKGSTTAALSVFLVESGLKVGAITSPAYRTNRERIRIQNRAIPEDVYFELAKKLDLALIELPTFSNGYLSPSGAFLVMGVEYFLNSDVDVILIEEGMGGISDEIGLFEFDAVVLTPVFLEHLGKLGSTVKEIAEDLLGILSNNTECLFSQTQSMEIEELISQYSIAFGLSRFFPDKAALFYDLDIPPVMKSNFNMAASTANFVLQRYFPELGLQIRREINIPGRYYFINSQLSGGKNWFIDASNNPEALKCALDYLETKSMHPARAFICFSNTRNRDLGMELLHGIQIIEVLIKNVQSRVEVDVQTAVSVSEALQLARESEGLSIFVGCIWYISNILDAIDANMEVW